jgi:beta-glucanase (GH16 family)
LVRLIHFYSTVFAGHLTPKLERDLIGGRPTQAQTNLFYKGIKEFNVHNTSALVPSGIDNVHIYSVDWKRDAITWSVDDTVVRTVIRENSTSQRTPPGERWFPSTPSQIKISIWDAGSVPDNGTQAWAGGVIPWGDRFTLSSQFEYIDIQCYNDQMQSVRTWPSDNSPNANISYPPSTSFFPGSKLPIVIKEESSALANSYWSALSFTFSLIGLLGFF